VGSDLHPFQDLYDAAIRHSATRIRCSRCSHVVIVHTAGLWRLFWRNGWNDRFEHVRRRLYCRFCWHHRSGIKVRPDLDFCDEMPTFNLPAPERGEWKHEARRRR
jgi:hypothetical protein